MSAVPPPKPDSVSVLTKLTSWLGDVLNDILRLLADPEGGALLLAEHGWDAGAPVLPPSLLGRLDQASQAGTDPGVQAAESFADVLIALAAFTEALRNVPDASASLVTAEELVADVLDAVMYLRLREDHPALWSWLRALNLIGDYTAQLANLSDLVGDTQKYLTGLVAGPGYELEMQDWSAAILGAVGTALSFIPPIPRHGSHDPHGHDQTSFRAEVLYGWTPAGPDDHPNLMQVLDRTLTWRLDAQLASTPATATSSGNPGIEEVVDLTFALVPAEHNQGAGGLFFRLSGATSVTIPLGAKKPPPDNTPTGWQLEIASTDGVALFALFSGAHGFVRGAGDGYKLTVALERPDDINGSWVWAPGSDTGDPVEVPGSDTGNHVEIQHARLGLTIAQDAQGWLADVGAYTDHAILNVELGGDSFLSSVLPPSLRIDTKLSIGWNQRNGVYLSGGTGLVVDLPANLTLGPASVLALRLRGLHLRIGASDASFAIAFTLDAELEIAGGVVVATVAGTGVSYSITQGPTGPGTAGHWQPQLNWIAPTGLGIQVVSDAVSGGGFIGRDPAKAEYAGAAALRIDVGPIDAYLVALLLLDTRIPTEDPEKTDWALLAILAVTFDPGVQIGLGFTLSGIGGVLGINHTVDSDAIAAGLRTKALDTILFPPDPVGQAPHIFAVWKQTMPPADGHTIVGPMFRINWGAGSKIGYLELALLIELDPAPVQLVLLGSLAINAPTETFGFIHLRAQIYGRVSLHPLDVMIEAELVDSKIAGFPVSGGLVLAGRRGTGSFALLSVGGFHPQFTPPANVPVPQRIRLDFSPGNNPRLRLEAYVALTTGTIQLGGRGQLHASAGPVALDGWLGFDGLCHPSLHSLTLHAELVFGASLSYDGSVLAEVNVDAKLDIPGDLHGTASLSLLFFSVSVPFDLPVSAPLSAISESVDPFALVRDALSGAGGWSAAVPAGTSPVVVLKTAAGSGIPAHPLAQVACHQNLVPLGLSITHIGDKPLGAPAAVDVTAVSLNGAAAGDTEAVDEMFAAPQFLTLKDDEALSRPCFEPMRAGLAAGAQTVDAGNSSVVATAYKTVAVDGAARTERPPWLLDLVHATAVLEPAAPAPARPMPPNLSVAQDTLRSAGSGAPQTLSLALQRGGGARLYDQVGVAGAPR